MRNVTEPPYQRPRGNVVTIKISRSMHALLKDYAQARGLWLEEAVRMLLTRAILEEEGLERTDTPPSPP